MKWKYKLAEEEDDQKSLTTPPQIFINTLGSELTTSGSIRVVGNKIFFYAEVTEQSALELNQALHDLDNRLQYVAQYTDGDLKPCIKLHINSYGGSIFAGLAILDTMRSIKSDIHTFVDGAAASAATMISIAGTKRFIGKNSMMLIHQLSTVSYGKFSELEDDMENNKRLMKMIKDIYKQYTKVPMKNIDEILKHDLWFDSAKCLEFGLVDGII